MPNSSIRIVGIIFLAFVLRLIVVQTPFLGTWDERFHALVAKNLIDHPFKPTLYDDPVLSYDFKEWSSNHVWLSKPPLALWFMAGSMSIFGVNEIALRLPSLIFSLFSVYLTFLIGRKLFGPKVALLASLLHSIHGLTIEVTCGRLSSDHIEALYLLILQIGLLLTIKYFQSKEQSKQIIYVLLLGIVTGIAFMTKWIAAAFIPIIWFCIYVWINRSKYILRLLIHGIVLVTVAVVSCLPLIVYLYSNFPVEADFFIKATILPIQQTIQGHQEPWYFFLDQSRIIFGEIIYLPMIWLIYKNIRKPKWKNGGITLLLIFVPLILLSFMETKRSTYILISSVGFYFLTALFYRYFRVNRKHLSLPKPLITLVLIALIALPIRYSLERVKPFKQWEAEAETVKLIKTIPLKNGKTIVFNEPNPIRMMFYKDDVTAYSWIPEHSLINELVLSGYNVVIQKEGNYHNWE